MNIYIFSLLVGYAVSGVDHSIGTLHSYFKKVKFPLKYVFTDIPDNHNLKKYSDLGIDWQDMICAHFSVAGNASLGGAQIQTREYHANGKITVTEAFTDRPLYIDHYRQIENSGPYDAFVCRRTFLKPDGSVAYDIIYNNNGSERYIFPDGKVCSKEEFLITAMQSFCFSEDDLIIIHRPGYLDFIEPLFLCRNKARILVFLHSGHEFLNSENPYFYGLNPEYFYFFQNADKLDAILVSTTGQKNDVINAIEEYHFPKTNVEVLPVLGAKVRKKDSERKPFSLLTVSRLDPSKHIDLLIRAAAQAHKLIPELSLDIYGAGASEYVSILMTLIEDAQASSYITLKGYCDVSNIYDNYEVYLTASTTETFGITLLEAASAGNAMIGFKARYGNTLFIKPEENGYLIDADFPRLWDEQYQSYIVNEFVKKIQLIFSDPQQLECFHGASYALAEDYSYENIEKMWTDYLNYQRCK